MTLWAHVHATIRARASELALGAILFNLSLVLSFNPTLFSDNPKVYAGFNAVFSQEVWAALCAVIGGTRLVVLMINGFWVRSPIARLVTAFLAVFVWFNLTWGVVAAGIFGIGLAVYPILLLFDSYNVLRTVDDAVAAARAQRLRGNSHDRATGPHS